MAGPLLSEIFFNPSLFTTLPHSCLNCTLLFHFFSSFTHFSPVGLHLNKNEFSVQYQSVTFNLGYFKSNWAKY